MTYDVSMGTLNPTIPVLVYLPSGSMALGKGDEHLPFGIFTLLSWHWLMTYSNRASSCHVKFRGGNTTTNPSHRTPLPTNPTFQSYTSPHQPHLPIVHLSPHLYCLLFGSTVFFLFSIFIFYFGKCGIDQMASCQFFQRTLSIIFYFDLI